MMEQRKAMRSLEKRRATLAAKAPVSVEDEATKDEANSIKTLPKISNFEHGGPKK